MAAIFTWGAIVITGIALRNFDKFMDLYTFRRRK